MCSLGLGGCWVVEIVLGAPSPPSPLDLGRQVCAGIVVRAGVVRRFELVWVRCCGVQTGIALPWCDLDSRARRRAPAARARVQVAGPRARLDIQCALEIFWMSSAGSGARAARGVASSAVPCACRPGGQIGMAKEA